ncbi:maltose permease [Xylariales sp. AK1849]|nr:maltose permease [Xylariales sp. AK1849]
MPSLARYHTWFKASNFPTTLLTTFPCGIEATESRTQTLILSCNTGLLIFILPVNFGYEVSTSSNLLAVDSFLLRFGTKSGGGTWVISATDQQILNAATSLGIFLSAFATGFLSDAFGRKRVIIVACLLCVAGILVQYFASTIPELFGGNLIGCFGFGLGHSLGPVYVAELAPMKLRGVCLALVNTMIVIGQWLSSGAVYSASSRYDDDDDRTWRIPIITQLIPPAIILIGSLMLPESPSWLIIKGRREEAAKAFRTFNGPKFDVSGAMAVMTAAVMQEQELEQASRSYSWIDCFKGPNGRRTLIICMVYVAQQFIGVNFVAGYLTYYLKLAGVDNALGMAQMAFAIRLFGNICSWPLIDRLGRRPMVVGGMFIMIASLLIIGGLSTMNSSSALKATVAFMTLWGFLRPWAPWLTQLVVRHPSPSHRQLTYSINIMTATVVSRAVIQAMLYLINTDQANLGGKICFVFFAPSVLMSVYLYFCLLEMKGRSYAELEEMFQNRVLARKFKGYVCHGARELSNAVKEGKDGQIAQEEAA